MSERDLISTILISASQHGARLFRNSVGLGWIGKILMRNSSQVLLGTPTQIKFGLCKGASDTLGWKSVRVTQDMVGKRVAIFVACEVKTAKLRTTPEQDIFLQAVREAGGIALVARSVEDVERVLGG